jgi:hypothetical protein
MPQNLEKYHLTKNLTKVEKFMVQKQFPPWFKNYEKNWFKKL